MKEIGIILLIGALVIAVILTNNVQERRIDKCHKKGGAYLTREALCAEIKEI